MEDTRTTDPQLDERLDAFLSARERADSWRVERVLKSSAFETTEVVWFDGAAGGSLGPFVRKHIDCSAGVGSAYEELYDAQRRGIVLSCTPRIVECVRAGDRLTVVLEFVCGRTLADEVAARGASARLAAQIMPALCDAVAELHELLPRPLIHRDLTPSNVIVRAGSPVIIDFGIARSWREGSQTDTAHFGTRAYAPPEQFGFGQTDERSDVYALGKLALFCLTGTEPAVTVGAAELDRLGVPASYAFAIARATAFDPAARFACARELGRALRGAERAGYGAHGPTPPSIQEQQHELREEPAYAAAGVQPAAPAPFRAASGGTGFAVSGPRPQPVPTRSRLAGAAHAAARLAGRIPRGVGLVWNGFVLAVYALFFAVCVWSAFFPNERDRAYPFWFLLLEYGALAIAVFGPAAYALLDKRCLFKRFPRLGRVPLALQLLCCLGIAVATVFAVTFIGLGAGLL